MLFIDLLMLPLAGVFGYFTSLALPIIIYYLYIYICICETDIYTIPIYLQDNLSEQIYLVVLYFFYSVYINICQM